MKSEGCSMFCLMQPVQSQKVNVYIPIPPNTHTVCWTEKRFACKSGGVGELQKISEKDPAKLERGIPPPLDSLTDASDEAYCSFFTADHRCRIRYGW